MQTAQMLKSMFLTLFLLGFGISPAKAASGALFDGRTALSVDPTALWSQIQPGTVLVIGEEHNQAPHQAIQLQVIKKAQELGFMTSVGMEFFEYPGQMFVDPWRQGKISEQDFLKNVGWGGFPFAGYRPQVLAPRWGLEFVLALNAPRSLTGKISKTGLESLSPQEQSLLPPQFEIGNDRYFQRFQEAVGHLPNADAAKRYFTAQSLWDDTMAWQAARFMSEHPEQVLVVIVGEFHVQYGGGLPDRLRARGLKNILTLSQVSFDGLSELEQKAALQPDATDGPRADFIWATRP